MRLVYDWLRELVAVPGDPDGAAHEIGLRGFEVAGVEHGAHPVIDFEITANRPDCLNHVGLAREAAAIWGLPLQIPATGGLPASGFQDQAASGVQSESGPSLEIDLEAPDLCPRYCAQVFEVRVGSSRGLWLEGAPHFFMYRDADGTIHSGAAYLAGNTLLWEREGHLLRLEGALTKAQALRVARAAR